MPKTKELSADQELNAQLSAIPGKPIQLRPSHELRKALEAEAEKQSRSLNNLILVILARYFKARIV